MFATVRDVRLALTPDGDTADQSTAASMSDVALQDALDEAESIVRMHVEQRYAVPEPDTLVVVGDGPGNSPDPTETVPLAPHPIRGWTRTIAAYLATLTNSRNEDVVDDDPIVRRYNMTMDFLTRVKTGNLSLDLPAVGVDESGGDVFVINITDSPLFRLADFHLIEAGYDPQILVPLRRW